MALGLALGVGGAFFWKTLPDRRPETPSHRATSITVPIKGEFPTPPAISPAPPHPEMAQALSLAATGRFPDAFASAQKGSPDLRCASLASVCALWASQQPRLAAQAALALSDSAQRTVAWHAVATTWADRSPDALAAYALLLSDQSARNQAFDAALPRWLERDESAALAWVGALQSATENDHAVTLIALHPPLIERSPELALSLAEAIQDASLRSHTLGQVVRGWIPSSPDQAADYARHSPDLLPSEREDILVDERFTAHP
jgi:hypothetical protein